MQLRTKKPGSANSSGWSSLPAWTILPLRGFLGITFVYAGLQKLTDPQFFSANSRGYIGFQLQIFAHSSPLRWLLENLAIPHAALFGWLIALGELWVGIATLLGLFSRLTAGAGLFISGLLWLTATWSVTPYFLGSDSIYALAWLTLLLTGMGDYSADQWLAERRSRDQAALLAAQRRTRQQPTQRYKRTPAVDPLAPELRGPADVQRRALLRSILAGGAVLATGAVAAFIARLVTPTAVESGQAGDTAGAGASPTSTVGSAPAGNSTPAPTTQAGEIGNTSQIPTNSDLTFTLTSGDPGVVVHLPDNKFVAYDAVCTHAGCTVYYDPNTSSLLCPCHGAAFDPANNGAVLGGPTDQPLASVPIRIDSSGNIIETG